MSWHLGMLAAFDLETTGIDTENDRIVTACVARIDGSNPGQVPAKRWLVNPGIDIPQGAIDVHGITNEQARADGMHPAVAVTEIVDMLGRALDKGIPIVGFNIVYDLTLLDRECRRHGLAPLADPAPVIDALILDKYVDKWRKGSRKLTATAAHYEVALEDAHDASADAWAAAGVACRIAQRFPQIGAMALDELHALQVAAKREQDASFADYLRRQNKPTDGVTGHWPVIPVGGE